MTEREREALMRLTMCARNECVMCKYKDSCDSDVRFEFATKHMNILAEALRKTEPTISKMEQVDKPKTQTETQNSNLTFEKADDPQTSCKTCRYGEVDEGYVRCAYYSKSAERDEPQTEAWKEPFETDCSWK